MKKPPIVEVALLPVSIILLLVCVGLLQNGCGSLDSAGAYGGNKMLYQADLSIATSYDLIDGFLSWELAHRAKPECPVSITQVADDIRAKAPQAFTTALAARDAYSLSQTVNNLSTLQKTLAALHQLLATVNTYWIPTKLSAAH